MASKNAFSHGRGAAARLPASAGIRPGDPIRTTVLAPGKVVIESDPDLPEYACFVRKRSNDGGNVTNELVAKLLYNAGF